MRYGTIISVMKWLFNEYGLPYFFIWYLWVWRFTFLLRTKTDNKQEKELNSFGFISLRSPNDRKKTIGYYNRTQWGVLSISFLNTGRQLSNWFREHLCNVEWNGKDTATCFFMAIIISVSMQDKWYKYCVTDITDNLGWRKQRIFTNENDGCHSKIELKYISTQGMLWDEHFSVLSNPRRSCNRKYWPGTFDLDFDSLISWRYMIMSIVYAIEE